MAIKWLNKIISNRLLLLIVTDYQFIDWLATPGMQYSFTHALRWP